MSVKGTRNNRDGSSGGCYREDTGDDNAAGPARYRQGSCLIVEYVPMLGIASVSFMALLGLKIVIYHPPKHQTQHSDCTGRSGRPRIS